MKAIAALIFTLSPALSFADWGIDFVKISCVPEVGYFSFEYKGMYGPYAIGGGINRTTKHIKDRLKAWRKNGFFDPSSLSYKCKLPRHTFTLQTSQQVHQGACGQAPPIILNLSIDGKNAIKDVILGDDCMQNEPTLTSFEVTDTGAPDEPIETVICTKLNASSNPSCEVSHKPLPMPMTMDSIKKYATKRR